MNRLTDYRRCKRLIHEITEALGLELSGIRVLTETGSGPFVLTPMIAALACAEGVVAVTRDSAYGSAEDVKAYTECWADALGVANRIQVSFEPSTKHAPVSDLVTNLGFVRPITGELLEQLPSSAAVALMWEPWEFRSEDLDLVACRRLGIPVLGTDEQDPRLGIFRYVGLTVVRLLLESGLELFRSRVIVLSSGVFEDSICRALESLGAELLIPKADELSGSELRLALKRADAIVLAEHRARDRVLIGPGGIAVQDVADSGARVIHLCGLIDHSQVVAAGVKKLPAHEVKPGYMGVTTAHLGPRPIIDLHAAGLKVGEALVRGMRRFSDVEKAVSFALESSPALDFPEGRGSWRHELGLQG